MRHRLRQLSACLLPWVLSTLFAGCSTPPYGKLHAAARDGNTVFVKEWVAANKNVDVLYNDTGENFHEHSRLRALTPLMVAAHEGHLAVVKLLVDAGADIYKQSYESDKSDYRYAFDWAVFGGHVQVAKYLWSISDKKAFRSQVAWQLPMACRNHCNAKVGTNQDNLAVFLAGIAPNDTVLGEGISGVACWPKGLEHLEFLKANSVGFPKNSLHCIASYEGSHYEVPDAPTRVAIATFLLEQGGDPNDLPARDHFTPLMRAASAQDLQLVTLFVQNGIDVNFRNGRGATALTAAVNSCLGLDQAAAQLAVVKVLLKAGAKPTLSPEATDLFQRECCVNEEWRTPVQQQICGIFGLVVGR